MKDSIRTFIAGSLLSGTDIANDDELLLSGLLDSMSVMRLVLHLETTFSVTIPPKDVIIEHFSSVETITAYLETRVTA
ncbi:MAG: acyl carrier protein [Geminicoccaceae bacterium]